MASNNQGNSKRGFASMDKQRQREAGRMSHKNDGNR